MEKSKKLYVGGIIVETISILLSVTYMLSPSTISLIAFPYLNLLLLLTATSIFIVGLLSVTFGRNAEKSERWFQNVSVIFSAYENTKAKVA